MTMFAKLNVFSIETILRRKLLASVALVLYPLIYRLAAPDVRWIVFAYAVAIIVYVWLPRPARSLYITISSLLAAAGYLVAVKELNLTIEPGTAVALLGPNGAGKTTSIAMMLGLLAPTQGHVKVFGGDPGSPRQHARIGVMQSGKVIADAPPERIKMDFGGRQVSFVAGPEVDVSRLKGLPEVMDVQTAGRQVSIRANNSDALLRRLIHSEWDISDIQVGGGGLEDAFILLTTQEEEHA